MQRHFARLGLNTRPDGSPPQAFGRFEAAAPGRPVDRRRPARPGHRRAQDLPVLLHRRPQPRPGRLSLRALRGHRPARGGVARGARRTRRARAPAISTTAPRWSPSSCCGRVPASGSAWCTAGRVSPRAAGRSSGSSRPCASSSSSRSRPGRRPTWPSSTGSSAPGSRPSITAGSTQRPVQAPIERLLAGAPAGAADPSGAPRGLLVVRSPHGDQDGHGLAALEHLRGRRRPGGVARRGGLRPLRPHHRRDPLPGALDGPGAPGQHRPALAPPGPSRGGPRPGAHRHRLPGPVGRPP